MSLIPKHSLFDFDQFFDHFFASGKVLQSEFFSPRIDVSETEDSFEISAELPGVKKEDIHVTLEQGMLSVEAEVKQENQEEKQGKMIRQERRYGKIIRSFYLGENVQQSDVIAAYDDGVLKLSAPKKTPSSSEGRRIEIR